MLTFNASDSVTIRDYFFDSTTYNRNTNGGRIEQISFADGTTWDYAAVAAGLTVNGTAGVDSLTGLTGVANRINGLGGNDIITGAELADVLDGGAGDDTIYGLAGNDTLRGGAGVDLLDGGTGNDTYWMERGYGNDTVTENDATAGNTDVARFATDIAASQLWFKQNGNNLEVSVIGTSDQFVMTNWYLGSQFRVEQFKSGDGKTLLDSQVQNLVQAMAGFAPPAAGVTTLSAPYQASLTPLITANWV